MELYRSFSWLEGGLLLLFALFASLHAYRVLRAGKKLGASSGASPLRLLPKLSLRFSYFILFIIALMGPSFGEQKKEVKSQGKDIFFAVDLSRSMDANDLSPSRLDKMKLELSKIVQAFSGDRLGLIIFTSEAFLQCPLTFDHQALLNLFVVPLSTRQISNAGTDFAPPLRMALEKMQAQDELGATRQSSKIIIVISDGEDFGEETESLASEVKESGIKLFALGVGTAEGGKIPDGYKFKLDRNGEEVVTKLNARALQELAQATGGQYFEISNKRNDTNKLINSISRIEGETRKSRMMDASANKYYYFLGAALVLMMLDILLTIRTLKLSYR